MKTQNLDPKQIEFYHKTKKSLENLGFVLTSRNNLIDFMILNVKRDIQLFKLCPIWDEYKVEIWIEQLKKWHKLAWYKATYTIVFFDEDFIEIKRKFFNLN